MDIFTDPLFTRYLRRRSLHLVDIGASGGLLEHWKCAEEFLQVIAFEPDEREFKKLVQMKDPRYIYFNTVLHKEKTILDFYCTRRQETSSIFQPNRDFLSQFPDAQRFDILQKVTVEADTLDRQLLQVDIHDVDFLKVDTQGSELFILQGAERTLQSVFGIEVEVEFAELYKGQPLFSDVELYLREREFLLFDLRPYYWKRTQGQRYGKAKGQLIFADVLFLKRPEAMRAYVQQFSTIHEKREKMMRVLAICSMYGYCDYAIEIIARVSDVFSLEEGSRLILFFSKQIIGKTRIPVFRGRWKIAALLRKVAAAIEPMGEAHIGGAMLGNR